VAKSVLTKKRESQPLKWFVYILRCADNSLYTGVARDVAARLRAHESGRGARYTRSRGPLELCAVRRCPSKGAALGLEYSIKQLTKPEKERLLGGRRLSTFARARLRNGV
jgi:putative endonuclease